MGSTIGHDLRTLPNIITSLRILLLWLGVMLYFHVSEGVGIAFCIAAGLTDYLDGYIARRTKQVTRLGEILDQFGDLCFESFLIIIMVARGFLPPYVIYLYLFREFWVTCVRRFMAEAKMNVPSSLVGKAKTNILMWGLLPCFLSAGGVLPVAEPYLGHVGRFLIGAGLLAGYISALGYTKAFVAGYAEATGRLK
jgi:CDP-diacylglycerol--glycerol-3-phosphate 3-phosphatidyltransferase